MYGSLHIMKYNTLWSANRRNRCKTGTHISVFPLSWIGKSIAAKRLILSDFYLTVELRTSPVCKTEEYRIPNKDGPVG